MCGFPDSDEVIERNGYIDYGVVLHDCQLAGILVGIKVVVINSVWISERCLVAATA